MFMKNSRAKTLGLHEWTKDDTILSLYVTKFGTKGMFLKTEKDVASFIGVSEGSLKMQCANIRSLSGEKGTVLDDYSKLQAEVFEEFNKLPQYELLKLVKVIIDQDGHERAEILRKMGLNPGKMKLVKTTQR